jgi:branched-chain amino acid transport system permease protein
VIDVVAAGALGGAPAQIGLGTFVSVLVDGLSKAAIYVMIAAGLTLIFGLMGVLNFAHGSLTMLGAYAGGLVLVVAISSGSGAVTRLAVFFAAVVAVFAVLTALGAALEMTLVRPLYDRPPLYQILLTFGLTLIFDEFARMLVDFYGLQPRSAWQEAIGTKPEFLSESNAYDVAGTQIVGLDLFEILLGVVTVAAIWAFLTRTRYGLYIRAGSEDAEMAEALGINIRRAFTVVFGVGVGVAGAAGVLLAWDTSWGASVPLGAETLLPAFVVVIIGGLGTFRGTVLAALLVGMVDGLMTYVFNSGIVKFPGLPELTVFLTLVVMLIVRPQGLAGVEEVGGH